MRNRIVLVVLLFAQALMLGHNVIPHHHHNAEDISHHSDHSHNHDHHPFQTALSQFAHIGEDVVFIPVLCQQVNAEKKFNPFILPEFVVFTNTELPHKAKIPLRPPLTAISCYNFEVSSLRGPPSQV